MVQETTNRALVESAVNMRNIVMFDKTSADIVKTSSSDDDSTTVASGKERCHVGNVCQSTHTEISRKGKRSLTRIGKTKRKLQKHVSQKSLLKTKEDISNCTRAPGKMKQYNRSNRRVKGLLDIATFGGGVQIYTSNMIIDHFALQSGDIKKHVRGTIRTSGKMQQKSVDASTPLKVDTRNTHTARPSRKQSLFRRLKGSSVSKPMVRGRSAPVAISYKDFVGDKAENNNWMIDNEETSEVQGGIVIPTFHSKSRATSFSAFIQPNSVAKAAFMAASSDDSGGFLNESMQSSNSLTTESDGNQLEGTSNVEQLETKFTGSVGDSKQTPGNQELCSVCGNQKQKRGADLCKNCKGSTKQDGTRSSPLDELRAYAQSIANSVKKILLLSPGSDLSYGIIKNSIPKKDKEVNIKTSSQIEEVSNKSSPDIALHRYMTETNMTSTQEIRSKALLNKSVSYDGRVVSCLEDKGMHSPMYRLNQESVKVSESSTKLCDSNVSYVDGCYFATGKENKTYMINECDKNKIGRDKLKARVSMKQLARVERARTDGDLRIIPQQNMLAKKMGKDDQRNVSEFHRNRSKTLYENCDLDEIDEFSQSYPQIDNGHQDINISRQKVIHEGSPVDPPCNFENRKCEDNRGRKAMFIRSATAPYKNHVSKKDMTIGEKLSALENVNKTNKLSTKVTVRTNKASTLRKENSLSDKKKVPEISEPQLENSRDEAIVMSSLSFTRRRSTSYEGSHQSSHRRDDVHRSMSWSVVDGDDEGSRQRRASVSASNNSIKRQKEHSGIYPVKDTSRSKLAGSTKKRQERNVLNNDPFLHESSTETVRCNAEEHTCETLPSVVSKDIDVSNTVEHIEPKHVQNKSSHFNAMRYNSHDAEKRLSPCIEDVLGEDQSETRVDAESYYCYTDTSILDNKLVSGVVTATESSFYNETEGGIYHNETSKYEESENVSSEENSLWYNPLQETTSGQRAVVRRDRSLESKSSTSFHLATTVKSSHSDEALRKHSEAWEHSTSRKQSMYTETDVDTGIIYHLAKRQTTRAHVPPYHDLTSASRDIYTMSGDVSTSTSSNSAISTKSEMSECAYTGGFYKEDPFYDNECKDSSSSVESSSHIYFEPDGISKKVPSDVDIYTGSIFNCNQNTSSLSQASEVAKSNITIETLNDACNFTRSSNGRTQRRLRYRPRIDAIPVRNNGIAWNYMYKPILAYGESNFYNTSNNSNNWCGLDEFEASFNQGSIVTKSKEPLYTDYDPGMRPEFHVRTIEKTGPVFDFLKYESTGETNASFFSSPQRDNCSGDSTWYSGLLHGQSIESIEKGYKRIDESPDGSMFSWQYSDDYYTSNVRPRINVNKLGSGKQGQITRDTNNNYFDDIYTGSYGAQNVQPRVQEQPSSNTASSSRQPASENWYVKQPTPKLTSTTFYDQSQDSVYTDSARKSSSDIYESVKDSRSSTAVFGKETASYSGSNSYMADDSYRKYEQSHRQTVDEPQKPHRLSADKSAHEETESYFNYISNKTPDRGFYIDEDDTYSFEEKVVKETHEVPVIKEIKTVGGIVCRENVANKEDYAEDINRDLEPGPWTPFSFRRDDEIRHPIETGGGHDKSEILRASEAVGQGPNKHFEDTSYAHNRIYDNVGARNKWREMATSKKENEEIVKGKETPQHRSYQAGDTGKEHGKSPRTSPDIIPDRARGKRTHSTISKTAGADGTSTSKSSGSTSARGKRF